MNISKFNLRSLFLNFYLFPPKIAIRMPVLVHKNVIIRNLKRGCIELKDIYPGMVQIGYNENGIFDYRRDKTLININSNSKIIIGGRLFLGLGCNISTNPGARLIFGKNNNFNGKVTFISNKKITFGNDNLVSWNCTFIDTDFHSIYKDGCKLNDDKDIWISNNVWIGMNSLVLKGAKISNNIVIGAGSVVAKELDKMNCVYAGNPLTVIKDGVKWEI